MNSRLLYPLILISILIVLNGCATSARMGQMKAEPQGLVEMKGATPLKHSISIKQVEGGTQTNPIGKSQIENDAFKDALTISLLDARLLAGSAEGPYVLEAKIIDVDQPSFGFSLTATTRIQYTLTRTSDGKEIFRETISAPYTAQFTDSLIGHVRLKLANEGSVRSNITRLIEKLYQLDIAPQTVSLLSE